MTRVTGLDVSPITEYLYISSWLREDHAEAIRLPERAFDPVDALDQALLQLLDVPRCGCYGCQPSIFPLRPCRSAPCSAAWRPPCRSSRLATCVLVHCRAGVHRSVAMACCVLIGMGMTAEERHAIGGAEALGCRSTRLVYPAPDIQIRATLAHEKLSSSSPLTPEMKSSTYPFG